MSTAKENIDFTKLKVADLKKLCKERNFTGISKFRKDELVYYLTNGVPPDNKVPKKNDKKNTKTTNNKSTKKNTKKTNTSKKNNKKNIVEKLETIKENSHTADNNTGVGGNVEKDKKSETNNNTKSLLTHCCKECCGPKFGLLLGAKMTTDSESEIDDETEYHTNDDEKDDGNSEEGDEENNMSELDIDENDLDLNEEI